MTSPLRRSLGRRLATAGSRLIQSLPYALYAPSRILLEYTRSELRVRAALRRGVRRLDWGEVMARKSSDTLFILGSGASINRLTDAQWAAIGAANSIGINYWPIHEFVPTFLTVEQPGDPLRAELLYRLLHVRAADYAGTPVLLKSAKNARADLLPAELRPRARVAESLGIPARDEDELVRSLRLMRRMGLVGGRHARGFIGTHRASISYAALFGAAAGYSTIVLLGVDPGGTAYFYEARAGEFAQKGIPVPPTGQAGPVHITVDRSLAGVPADRVVVRIDEEILRPAGARLFAGLDAQGFGDALPVYFA